MVVTDGVPAVYVWVVATARLFAAAMAVVHVVEHAAVEPVFVAGASWSI